jgi:hypothetical protein
MNGAPRVPSKEGILGTTLACSVGIGVLAPAWLQLRAFDRRNASEISAQQHADRFEGAEVDRLVGLIRHDGGGGRVYAGMSWNWGARFRVGAVPVFKYLERRDLDEVGYTLRTASLMSGPEYYFDDRNVSDYVLFGIRYLILPRGARLPVAAGSPACVGDYCLWQLRWNRYIHVGGVSGALAADRTDIGSRSARLLRSSLAKDGSYLRVAYGSKDAIQPSHSALRASPAGTTLAESDALARGQARATVKLGYPGVAVLSSSFDPGWHVILDGRKERPEMLAPALVGAKVPAGIHKVEFSYSGYDGYPLLLALAGAAITALLVMDLRRRKWEGEI